MHCFVGSSPKLPTKNAEFSWQLKKSAMKLYFLGCLLKLPRKHYIPWRFNFGRQENFWPARQIQFGVVTTKSSEVILGEFQSVRANSHSTSFSLHNKAPIFISFQFYIWECSLWICYSLLTLDASSHNEYAMRAHNFLNSMNRRSSWTELIWHS